MALVAVLVQIEKTLAAGERIAKWVGIALILYGVTVIIFPGMLPTFVAVGGMKMN